MVSNDVRRDAEMLERARACFAVASRLLYCDPQPQDVALQALSGQFAQAPFAMDDPSVLRGLELLGGWCARALRKAQVAQGRDASGDVLSEAEGQLDGRACALAADPAFCEEVGALQRERLRLFVGIGVPQASCFESFYVRSEQRPLRQERAGGAPGLSPLRPAGGASAFGA